jgi:hydroxyacid-oxoacid transhydrogenase
MSYAVSGLIKDKDALFIPDSYLPIGGKQSIVPHGMSVVLGAPASFEEGASTNPYRHMHAAALLGNEDAKKVLARPDGGRSVSAADAAALIFETTCDLMAQTHMPSGLHALGYTDADIPELVKRTLPQKRVIGNAPFEVDAENLERVFKRSMRLW